MGKRNRLHVRTADQRTRVRCHGLVGPIPFPKIDLGAAIAGAHGTRGHQPPVWRLEGYGVQRVGMSKIGHLASRTHIPELGCTVKTHRREKLAVWCQVYAPEHI